MTREEIIRSFDGTELYRCTDAPEPFRGTLVLLHGLGGHCRRFDEPVRQLNAAGWRVVRYDQRGHGRSGGPRAWLRDYGDLVADAKFITDEAGKDAPAPLFTCGYSMGGLISLLLGIRHPEGLSGQIFLGACACALPLYHNFRRPQIEKISMRTSPSIGSVLLSQNGRVGEDYDLDPWVLHAFTNKLLYEVFVRGVDALVKTLRLHALPYLALHGADDRIVPVESSRIIHAQSSSTDKTFEVLPNCWHDILHEPARDAALARILDWMEERSDERASIPRRLEPSP